MQMQGTLTRSRARTRSILEWHAIFRGPPDTPYAGGEYWAVVTFTKVRHPTSLLSSTRSRIGNRERTRVADAAGASPRLLSSPCSRRRTTPLRRPSSR